MRRAQKAWYQRNKAAVNARSKAYYTATKPRRLLLASQSYASLKTKPEYLDRKREYLQIYYQDNKEKWRRNQAQNRSKRRKRERERYANDPEFRLKRVFQLRVLSALKGRQKAARTKEMCGCSTAALRQHIERQWQPGMSWSNHGRGKDRWHIDHRIPCCRFDLSDPIEQHKCFHYTNLQPLWEHENLSKGGRLIESQSRHRS